MAFSSGTFSLYTPGNPVVTGTTIAISWANNTLNDIATGLSTCILKDGSQTVTANIPFSGFKLTGIGAATTNGDAVRWQQSAAGVMTTTGDIIQASSANTPARLAIGTARQVPAVNAGATALAYINPITITAEQATTSGTEFDFTGIPAGVRRITVHFSEVSLSGNDDILVQLGDAGGFEDTSYVSTSAATVNAAASVARNSTAGFIILLGGSGNLLSGKITINLERISTFHWVSGHSAKITTAISLSGGGDKSLSAELTQVRVTRSGTDTFDAGLVSISYE